MWFLLLQIFFLLVLAALCGAGLAWWWLKRRYEDVTESHEELRLQAGRLDALDGLATRADLTTAKDTLASAVADLRMPDMAPMEERMARLERAVAGIVIPEPDLKPVNERLEMIEAAVLSPDDEAPATRASLAALGDRIEGLANAMGEMRITGFGEMNRDMQALAGTVGSLRETGIGPLGEHIGRLELRLGEIQSRFDAARRTDIEAVTSRLANLSATLGALRIPEIAPVESMLAELETQLSGVKAAVAGISIPETDLKPVETMLGELRRSVSALDKPPLDLGPLHGRLAAVESALGAAIQPVERRIASMEEAIGTLPQPDFTSVITAVRQIDSREDLGAVEDRLTAIEYSLAALHHMMRARAEMQAARVDMSVSTRRTPRGPVRPPRETDPINGVRRVDDRANLLSEAAFGPPDDLKQINGVGPILCEMLHELGVFYFWQVAEWTPEEAAWVDSLLAHFRGRIARDGWVENARQLAASPGAARRPLGYEGRREAF